MANPVAEDAARWLEEILSPIITQNDIPTYRHLVGAALALQESITHLQSSDIAFARDEERLLRDPDFQGYVGSSGYVRFRRDKRMRFYAAEFFLNKAQTNIAAALDRLLNEWLFENMAEPYRGNYDIFEYDFLYLSALSRLRLVAMLCNMAARLDIVRRPAGVMLTQIMAQQARFGMLMSTTASSAQLLLNKDSVAASIQSNQYATMCHDHGALRVVEENGSETPMLDSDACAIIIGRVNAFKHQHRGLHDRASGLHYAEWAVTSRALRYIVNLVNELFGKE